MSILTPINYLRSTWHGAPWWIAQEPHWWDGDVPTSWDVTVTLESPDDAVWWDPDWSTVTFHLLHEPVKRNDIYGVAWKLPLGRQNPLNGGNSPAYGRWSFSIAYAYLHVFEHQGVVYIQFSCDTMNAVAGWPEVPRFPIYIGILIGKNNQYLIWKPSIKETVFDTGTSFGSDQECAQMTYYNHQNNVPYVKPDYGAGLTLADYIAYHSDSSNWGITGGKCILKPLGAYDRTNCPLETIEETVADGSVKLVPSGRMFQNVINYNFLDDALVSQQFYE